MHHTIMQKYLDKSCKLFRRLPEGKVLVYKEAFVAYIDENHVEIVDTLYGGIVSVPLDEIIEVRDLQPEGR